MKDTEPSKPTPDTHPPRWRSIVSWILIILGSVLLPLILIALWIRNTLLITDNYLAVVGPLSYNPTVATALTEYTAEQFFQTRQIETSIQNALPENAQFLVLPLTNSLLEFTQNQIYKIVTSQGFNRIWVETNRVLHPQIVNLLTGENQSLVLENGQVVLDIGPVLETVKANLGNVGLGLIERYAPTVNTEPIVLFQAPRLSSWQPYVMLIEQSAIALPFLGLVLFGLALWLAPVKKTALLLLGIGVSLAMLVVSALLSLGRTSYLNQPFRLPVTPEVATVLFDTVTQPLWYLTQVLFGIGLLTILLVLIRPKARA